MEDKAHSAAMTVLPNTIPDIIYRLKKRRLLITTCLLLTLGSAVYYNITATRIYSTTAVILIGQKSSISPLTGQSVSGESWASQKLDFKTHFRVVTAKPVLERVLKTHPVSDEKMEATGIRKLVSNVIKNTKRIFKDLLGLADQKAALDKESIAQKALMERLAWLRDKITVEEVEDTRLLSLTAKDPDPVFARDLTNTLVDTYLRYTTELRLEKEKKTVLWMQEQIYQAKKRVEDAEKRFIEYKEREKIFSLVGKQKITSEKMAETNRELVKARTLRQEVQARINEIRQYITSQKGGRDVAIPHFLSNQLLNEIYSNYLAADVEYRRLAGVYGRKHPEIIKITNKRKTLLANIRQEIHKILRNLKSERTVLSARENALQKAMANYEQQAISANRKELAYNFLEREVETNRQLYDLLLAKTKETKVTGAITEDSLQVVESAVLPLQPVEPTVVINIILSVFVGLLLGVGLAFFRDMMDQTIHNGEEAERYLGLSVLAQLPKIKKPEASRKSNKQWLQPNVVQLPLNSHFTESFRMLATNLNLSQPHSRHRVFMMTSTTPSEGKSISALNLGLTMALQGWRTLVLEGDMRRPTTHKKVKSKDIKPGLSDLLIELLGSDISQGALGDMSPVDIHKMLRIQQRTGSMTYQTPKGTFTVSFLDGQVIDAVWDQRPQRIPLGHYLIEKGILTESQAKLALEVQSRSRRLLGQILLGLRLAQVEDIVGPVLINTQEDLKELYDVREGEFRFEEHSLIGDEGIDPQEERLLQMLAENEALIQLPKSKYILNRMEGLLVNYDLDNFAYLAAGTTVPNPSSLIAGASMRYLIDEIKSDYETVIIDSPPASIISDASILASIADAVVIVVRAGVTPTRQVQANVEQLYHLNINLVGSVVNMIDFARDPHSSGYYRGYGEYYTK